MYFVVALTTEKEELLGNVKLLSGANSDLSKLGIQRHIAPRQPKHATYEGRLRTFRGWPENLRQTPEMLAIAGFYSVGVCFFFFSFSPLCIFRNRNDKFSFLNSKLYMILIFYRLWRSSKMFSL